MTTSLSSSDVPAPAHDHGRPPRRAVRDDVLLGSLLADVNRARSAFRAGRADPSRSQTRSEQTQRTERLAQAMASYADAAASAGIPLPYRYRDELRLYQAMVSGTSYGGRGRGAARY